MIKLLCGFVLAAFAIPLLIAAGDERLNRPTISGEYSVSPMTCFAVALLCLAVGCGLIFF